MGLLRKLSVAVLGVLSEAEESGEKASGMAGGQAPSALRFDFLSPAFPLGAMAAVEHPVRDAGVPGADVTSVLELKRQLALSQRKATEYFRLIEKLEQQRDEWKSMWHNDSAGHVQAQAMLQDALESMRQQFVGAVREINRMRKEQNLAPIANLAQFDPKGPPIGIAEQNRAENARLLAAMQAQTDASAARAAIDAKLGVLAAAPAGAPVVATSVEPESGPKEKG